MPHNTYPKVLAPIDRYYTGKIKEHGRTSRGVDWNSVESQELRFQQLLRVVRDPQKCSINDFGCGFGSLFSYLMKTRSKARYHGFDISEEMVANARKLYSKYRGKATFRVGHKPSSTADYGLASGIFNVRLKSSTANWKKYLLSTLDLMNATSRKGFSFNCLTKYSDKEKMRSYLHYADPLALFDHCKRKYSKNVALLHDYGLYEFTILVRKDL